MLISPTEPPRLRALGTVSLVPERYGADVLLPSATYGVVGIQRKEISDLLASVIDGRLQRELSQMRGLGQAILLVEGRIQWSLDGLLIGNSSTAWSKAQLNGIFWTVQSKGIWIVTSTCLDESLELLLLLRKWLAKTRHNSLLTRPGPQSLWGKVDDREWGIHILQGFAGIGPELAGRIMDVTGRVPLRWTITKDELMRIPGVGAKKADQLLLALDTESSIRSSTSTSNSKREPSSTLKEDIIDELEIIVLDQRE